METNNSNGHEQQSEQEMVNEEAVQQEVHMTNQPHQERANTEQMASKADAQQSTSEEQQDVHTEAADATQQKQATGDGVDHMDCEAKDGGASDAGTKKKGKFFHQYRNGIMIGSCFLLAGVGGFGGTMLAMNISGGNKTVLYQNVDSPNDSSNNTTDANSMSVKDVANKVAESVVEIKTESMTTNDFFQQAISSGAGSGVIISEDGYIVTNHHVIDGASKVTVTTKDGKSYSATLVGSDSTTDLAVIKIDATGLTPAVMGDSSTLEVGDPAIAIGNPLGSLGGTVTNGIISALDRAITIDNQTMHLLQTNAAINPGNSGGGLFDANGNLIGIVNAKSSGSNIEGLGFAIPINNAKTVISSLIENGYVSGRPELGVSLTEAGEQGNNPYGSNSDKTYVYIANVQSGKAADAAGLQRGDKVLEVDGKEVTSVADVKTCVSSHKAGETMTMKIERDGKEQTITITLQEASTNTTQKTGYSSSNSNSVGV